MIRVAAARVPRNRMIARLVFLSALAAVAVPRAVAQPPWRDLWSEDPVRLERARRRAMLGPLDEGVRTVLVRLLRHARVEVAAAAASVLERHGLAVAQRRALLDSEHGPLRRRALVVADEAAVRDRARGDPDPDVRAAALVELEKRGRLAVGDLAAALADDEAEPARVATAMLLYLRAPWPEDLWERLDRRARTRLLQALVDRPRREMAGALRGMLDAGRGTARERLWAIAALPPGAITRSDAREVLRAAADPKLGIFAATAAARFPPALADRLVGLVHRELLRGVRPQTLLPCLENASRLGERQLVALVGVLEGAARGYLIDWLAARGAGDLLDEWVAAALDGEIPMSRELYRYAGRLADRPRRVARLLELYRGGDAAGRGLALVALVEAGAYRREFLDEVLRRKESRDLERGVRKLLRFVPAKMPDEDVLRLLGHASPRVRVLMAGALAGRPLSPRVEERLVALVAAHDVAASAAVWALVRHGRVAALARCWPSLDDVRRKQALAWIAERGVDAARSWLRERSSEAPAHLRRHFWHALAALGDGGAAARLLASLGACSAHELASFRRVGAAALRSEHLASLRALLIGPRAVDARKRVELVRWLRLRADLGAVDLLARLRAGDPDEEVRMEALRGLLALGRGGEDLERVRAACARGLSQEERELAYELVDGLPAPLTDSGTDLMARLLLLEPLARPSDEVRADLEGGPWRGSHALELAVLHRLRDEPRLAVGPFRAVVRELWEHPHRDALSWRRVRFLLAQLARTPRTRKRLGPEVARLVEAFPEPDPRVAGGAWLVLAQVAEDGGRYARAAMLYEKAIRALVLWPPPPLLHRALLGESSLADGEHALAALSARADLCRARAALAEGREAVATKHAERAEVLGFGDRRTLAEIDALRAEIAALRKERRR